MKSVATCLFTTYWSGRLKVRLQDFQSCDPGSSPGRITTKKHLTTLVRCAIMILETMEMPCQRMEANPYFEREGEKELDATRGS